MIREKRYKFLPFCLVCVSHLNAIPELNFSDHSVPSHYLKSIFDVLLLETVGQSSGHLFCPFLQASHEVIEKDILPKNPYAMA